MSILKFILLASFLATSLNAFSMNKAELTDAIASNSGLSKADAKRALNSYIIATNYYAKQGMDVSLVGLGTFSGSENSINFNADKPLIEGVYHQYFKNFWSVVLQHNSEAISKGSIHEENPNEGQNPLYEDKSYFSSSSFFADAFDQIFTKLSPTDLVSAERDEKVKIAEELNRELQDTVSFYVKAHEAAHVVQQRSSRIMQDSVEALLESAIKQEKFYLNPKSENLGLTEAQLSMMSLLFHSNIDLADGHVTVLKSREDRDGHVTVLKVSDHNGHVTVLKSNEDHNGHVTVLKAMGPVGGIVTEAMKKDGMVVIDSLGTLSTPKRAARTGRNPQTGKEIKIAAKRVAKFKAGKALADTVK
ncbi:MAG: hypothetical protein CME71_02050 [Halobacteriovorax sp.]|nr:hypothetical protein [Halobacteriovorax sp.]